jgi:hypothetical protein
VSDATVINITKAAKPAPKVSAQDEEQLAFHTRVRVARDQLEGLQRLLSDMPRQPEKDERRTAPAAPAVPGGDIDTAEDQAYQAAVQKVSDRLAAIDKQLSGMIQQARPEPDTFDKFLAEI